MTDAYIDQDETQIYGPHASKKILAECVGLIKEYDPALKYVAGEIDKATAGVGAAVAAARLADAGMRKGHLDRKPALTSTIELLHRFSNHLDSHKKGAIDRKTFFTGDGTVDGIGRGTAKVLLALAHILIELEKKDSPLKDKETWAGEFKAAIAALKPVADHADSAKTDRRETTPAIDAAREAWLQTYTAAKRLVESVFRLTGKLNLMSEVFDDLAQPADAKVTKPPIATAPGK